MHSLFQVFQPEQNFLLSLGIVIDVLNSIFPHHLRWKYLVLFVVVLTVVQWTGLLLFFNVKRLSHYHLVSNCNFKELRSSLTVGVLFTFVLSLFHTSFDLNKLIRAILRKKNIQLFSHRSASQEKKRGLTQSSMGCCSIALQHGQDCRFPWFMSHLSSLKTFFKHHVETFNGPISLRVINICFYVLYSLRFHKISKFKLSELRSIICCDGAGVSFSNKDHGQTFQDSLCCYWWCKTHFWPFAEIINQGYCRLTVSNSFLKWS